MDKGMDPRQWMQNSDFLPPFLQDFHDAKDFFKTLQQYFKPSPELEAHTWVSNQIFTVDFFLWFCGIHGYTLQKSRKKGVAFENLEKTLREFREARSQSFAQMLNAHMAEGPAKPEQSSPNSPPPGSQEGGR